MKFKLKLDQVFFYVSFFQLELTTPKSAAYPYAQEERPRSDAANCEIVSRIIVVKELRSLP